MPGTPVTFRLKADVNGAGVADLGDNFVFYTATTSITMVGASTGSTISSGFTGSAAATSYTHIVPASVTIAAVSPSAPTTLGTGAGAVVGVYKVTNSGSAQVTLSQLGFSDNGSSTSTMTYNIYASADGGSQSDITTTVTSSMPKANIGSIAASLTINGGSHRYITVKTAGTADNYDTHDLGITSLGTVLYSVDEANLGYSGNPANDADLGDTVSSLYVDGKPSTDVVTHRNS
jgi:hypothetical protein